LRNLLGRDEDIEQLAIPKSFDDRTALEDGCDLVLVPRDGMDGVPVR
jgi:hypothetical protein